ncbi:MAG: hypothetical protein AAGC46_01450 [Solirubrobacteraceae bacterium]|nr:hypothetical protein [Patulibacter sp.]
MTTLIPALEAQLLFAADRTTPGAAPSPGASRRRARWGGLPLLAVVAASLTVSAGAYASRGLWLPQLGADSYGHAQATASPPPGAESSVLGVLRREQSDADRDVAVRAVLRDAGPSLGKIRTNAVRRLGTLPDGRVAVLVPARVPKGFDPTLPNMTQDQLLLGIYDPATHGTGGFLTSDALGMQAGDLMLAVSRRPSAEQSALGHAFLEREVRAGRLEKSAEPPYYHVLSVEQSERYARATGLRPTDPDVYVGVVPDGVAEVRVDGHTTVPVVGNFFAAPSTRGSRHPVVWLDAHGRTVPFASTIGAWK